MAEAKNLADGLNDEIERCLELVKIYEELGAVGQFGKIMIQAKIDRAKAARSEHDVVKMLQAYEALVLCE